MLCALFTEFKSSVRSDVILRNSEICVVRIVFCLQRRMVWVCAIFGARSRPVPATYRSECGNLYFIWSRTACRNTNGAKFSVYLPAALLSEVTGCVMVYRSSIPVTLCLPRNSLWSPPRLLSSGWAYVGTAFLRDKAAIAWNTVPAYMQVKSTPCIHFYGVMARHSHLYRGL